MKSIKYEKVDTLPKGALKVSLYAEKIKQKNPTYISVQYDRFLAGTGKDPGFKIINWQGFNFVVTTPPVK